MRLGVDFGTTRIVVAASDRGNYPVLAFESPDGEVWDWYPPLVGVKGSRRVYGWEAWAAQLDPDTTIIRSVKRLLADAGPRTPIEIAGARAPLSLILQELAADLGLAIRSHSNIPISQGEKLEVMIGVPAGANSNQRFLTVDAFRQAGFDVIGLLNEPSAASIEYGHRHREKRATKDSILVYDMGGGTFDVSLVELDQGAHAVIASEGIATLGGDDFDHVLADVALRLASLEEDELTQAEWFRLTEETRRKKEAIHPNSRRVAIDLDTVRTGWPQVHVPIAEFYALCEPMITDTLLAVDGLASRTSSLEAIYLTGGGSELPLVSRVLRERFKSKVQRSPYTRAATAIGLAIQADVSAQYVLRDRFARYFGVWREAEGGDRVLFDPIFAKGCILPQEGDPPLLERREYLAVHNVGHFRYLECSRLTPDGQPAGDITLWDEILFPFDAALRDESDLRAIVVTQSPESRRVAESFHCGVAGELTVTISNLDSGYERSYPLGRWGAVAPPLKPGKKKRSPQMRILESNANE